MSRAHFGRLYEAGRGWRLRVRVNGLEIDEFAGVDRKQAEQFRSECHRKHAAGLLFGEAHISPRSLKVLQDEVVEAWRATKAAGTLRSDRTRLSLLAASPFGDKPVHVVTAGDVAGFLAGLRDADGDPVTAATRNRYRALVRALYAYAVLHKHAAKCPDVGEFEKEDARAVPFLTDAEVTAIVSKVAETDPRFALFLRILADTGLRRGELCRMEWRDVQTGRGVVLVRKSKSKKPREVPMIESVVAAFKALDRAPTPLAGPDPVFPEYAGKTLDGLYVPGRRADGATHRWEEVRGACERPDMWLHDFRHGLASRLAQNNRALPVIQAILGHASIVTTMRYAGHMPGGATFEAMRSLNQPAKKAEKGTA